MSEKVLNAARAAELWEAVKSYVDEHGGPARPDGNPIGTILSFMGTKAPKDYLICDGTEYNISDYPSLAAFFKEQFGTSNHFGGDGADTFAVPDLRDLFLRGFHGEAEEPLSGEIGEIQEATQHLNIVSGPSGHPFSIGILKNAQDVCLPILNADSEISKTYTYRFGVADYNPSTLNDNSIGYENTPRAERVTSRPINTAVLFCIKAVESVSSSGPAPKDIYSTEETRIGTWIDGKPLYRRTLQLHSPGEANKESVIGTIEEHISIKNIDTGIPYGNGGFSNVPFVGKNNIFTTIWIYDSEIFFETNIVNHLNCDISCTIEYTKTTD